MKRKWFRPVVGPGLIAALALSALFIGRRMQPPHVARPVLVQHPEAVTAAGVPDPPFVLQQAAALGLSATQVAKVRAIAHDYAARTARLRAALDQATKHVSNRMEHNSSKPLMHNEIEELGRAVSELSALLAHERLKAWGRLAPVLTSEQQRRAKQAWAEAHRLAFPKQRAKSGG